MKPLLRIMFILASVFAVTFILGQVMGILTVENVRRWLEWAQMLDPGWVALTVIILLLLDLFVAVPTLTITILAGFFLGFPAGALAAFAGMMLAALCGFAISRTWGDAAISVLLSNEKDRLEMAEAFCKSGPTMIVLSRAAPIIPEVTACMAGATGMQFHRYCLYFTMGTLPYVLIASYAGSISSPDSPQPAIYTALILYAVLWSGWYMFQRGSRRDARD